MTGPVRGDPSLSMVPPSRLGVSQRQSGLLPLRRFQGRKLKVLLLVLVLLALIWMPLWQAIRIGDGKKYLNVVVGVSVVRELVRRLRILRRDGNRGDRLHVRLERLAVSLRLVGQMRLLSDYCEKVLNMAVAVAEFLLWLALVYRS